MLQGVDPILLPVGFFFLFPQQPFEIAPVFAGDLFDAFALVLAEADSREEFWLRRDVEHFLYRGFF